MDMLKPADAQQQIQSFYFIEVMNDYIQDAQQGQAFLLNEIRKNTGNIRLRADNVTMNTQQIELLLGGLYSHENYNELHSEVDPSSSYLIQELDNNGNPTGNVILTQDPNDLESTEYGLILQDILWEEIAGTNGGAPTYKEVSSFRYARDQIQEIITNREDITLGLTTQTTTLENAISPIYTTTYGETSATRNLVDVHTALTNVYNAVSGQDTTNVNSLAGVSEAISTSMDGTTSALIGTTDAWDTWNTLSDPEKLQITDEWNIWNTTGQNGLEPEQYVNPEPPRFLDQNLYDLIDEEVTAVTTALTDTIEITLEQIDSALRIDDGHLKTISETLTTSLDDTISSLKGEVTSIYSSTDIENVSLPDDLLSDGIAGYKSLHDIFKLINSLKFEDGVNANVYTLYDLYTNITDIHTGEHTANNKSSLSQVRSSIDNLSIKPPQVQVDGLDVDDPDTSTLFTLQAALVDEVYNLRGAPLAEQDDQASLQMIDTSVGGVETAISTLQGGAAYTVESLQNKVEELFVDSIEGRISLFNLDGNINKSIKDLNEGLIGDPGTVKVNLQELRKDIRLSLMGVDAVGTGASNGTSVTRVITDTLDALEAGIRGVDSAETINTIKTLEQAVDDIRGTIPKNLSDIDSSIGDIRGDDLKKNLHDIYERLGNLTLEVSNVDVNTNQLEKLIGYDFDYIAYNLDYIEYVDDIYTENGGDLEGLYASQILESGVTHVQWLADYPYDVNGSGDYEAYGAQYWKSMFLLTRNDLNEQDIYEYEGNETDDTEVSSTIFTKMDTSHGVINQIQSSLDSLETTVRNDDFYELTGGVLDLKVDKLTVQGYLDSIYQDIKFGLLSGTVGTPTSRVDNLQNNLDTALYTGEVSSGVLKLDTITNELLAIQGNTEGSGIKTLISNQSTNLFNIETDLELIRGAENSQSDLYGLQEQLYAIQGLDELGASITGDTTNSKGNLDNVLVALRGLRGGDDGALSTYDVSGEDAHRTTAFPTLTEVRDILVELHDLVQGQSGTVTSNPGLIDYQSSNIFELGLQISSLRGEIPELAAGSFDVDGNEYSDVTKNLHINLPFITDNGTFKTSNLYEINENLNDLHESLVGTTEPITDISLKNTLESFLEDNDATNKSTLFTIDESVKTLMGVLDSGGEHVANASANLYQVQSSIDSILGDTASSKNLSQVLDGVTKIEDDFTYEITNPLWLIWNQRPIEEKEQFTDAYNAWLEDPVGDAPLPQYEYPEPDKFIDEVINANTTPELLDKNLVDIYYKLDQLSSTIQESNSIRALENMSLSINVSSSDTTKALVGWDYEENTLTGDDRTNIFHKVEDEFSTLKGEAVLNDGTGKNLKDVESTLGGIAGSIQGIGAENTLADLYSQIGLVTTAIGTSTTGLGGDITGGDATTLSTISGKLTDNGQNLGTIVGGVSTSINNLKLGTRLELVENPLDSGIYELQNEVGGLSPDTNFVHIYNKILEQTEEIKKIQLEVGNVNVNTNQLEKLIGWDFGTLEDQATEGYLGGDYFDTSGDNLAGKTLIDLLTTQKSDIIDAIQEVTVNIGDVAVNTDQLERIIGWDFKAKTPVQEYLDFLGLQVDTSDNPINRQAFLDEHPTYQWDDLYESDEGEEAIVGATYTDGVLEDNNTILYRLSDAVTYLSNIDADTGYLYEAFTTGVAHQDLVGLTASINNIEADANSLSTSIDNLVKAIDDPDVADDQALNYYLNTVKETISGLDTSITDTLNVSISGLDTSVGLLKTEVATGSVLNQNLSDLKDSLASSGDLVSKLNTLDTSLGDLETDVTSLVGVVDENSTLNANLASVSTKVTALTSVIINEDEETLDLTDALGTLESVFAIDGTLLTNLNTVGTNLGTLETDVTSLIGVVDENSALTTAMDGIKTSLTTSIDSSLETIDNSLAALIADDFSTNLVNDIKGYVAAGNGEVEVPGATLQDIKDALIGNEIGENLANALGNITFDTTALTGTTPGRTLEEVWLKFDDLTVPGEHLDLIDVSQNGTPNNIVPKTLADVATSVQSLEEDIAKVREGLINETNMDIYDSYWLTGILYPEGAVSEDIIIPAYDYDNPPAAVEDQRVTTTDAFTEATGLFVYKLDEVAQSVTALKEFQKPTNDFENGSVINIPIEGNEATAITTEVFSCKRGVTVTAHTENPGIIFVGNNKDITAGTDPLEDGIPLTAGDSLFLPVLNPDKIFVIADEETSNSLYWLAV